jgi:membrane fusion protein
MVNQLFRREAIEARRDRLTGTVVAATPPRAGIYTILIVGICAAMLLIVTLGQFASRAHVTGVVAYDRGIARIYPPAIAEIRAIHVHEGDMVQAGTPLLTIALSQGRNADGDGVASQLAQISRQDDELVRQQQLGTMLGTSETQGLAQQRDALRAAIASLKRQAVIAAEQVRIAESQGARAGRLARASAGSVRQAEEAKGVTLTRRADREAIEERIITQQEALRSTEAQIAQREMGTRQTLSQIAGRRAELAAQRALVLRLDRLVLTAPIAGRVGDLIGQVGSRARPETSLVTVIPDDSRLEAWLYTPTRAAGFVQVGQEVRLQFDAFPFQKYGAGRGVVTEISRVPTDANAIDPGLKIDQPVFRIRVRIDRGTSKPGAADRPLRPGMTLAANLVLERRSLWEVLLDPLLRALRG